MACRSLECPVACALVLLAAPLAALASAADRPQPVTPNASPEAIRLLDYLYEISGKHTLSGQHCVPLVNGTTPAGPCAASVRSSTGP